METNKIILGDCFDVIQNIPDGSIDAVITDPPYMTTDIFFDRNRFCVDTFAQLLLPKLKKNGQLAMFGSIELLARFCKYYPIRWTGVWLKPIPTMRTATAKKPGSKSEIYAIFAHPKHKVSNLTYNKLTITGSPYKKVQRYTGYLREGKDSISRANGSAWTKDGYVKENNGFRCQSDVILAPNKPTMRHQERTVHPTQKPIGVMSTLMQWITNEGDTVLDPFCGSGTTAIACKELGRNYICIEKEPEYYQIACNRINQPIADDFKQEYPDLIIKDKSPQVQQLSLF